MKNKHDVKILKIDVFNFEDSLFDDKSIIVECILELDSEYNIKATIDNNCTDYSFIDIDIAHQVCEVLRISSLKLNKSREVKKYDERRNKDITHVIYSSMTIQNHTKSFTLIMIIKLDQHFIILKKSRMKKHDVSYHEHDDTISCYSDHCSHLEAFEHSYSNQKTKKKVSFLKRNFSDQSEVRIERVENKEIKIFLEKINNSSKMILKRSTEQSIELIIKRLNEFQKKLNEGRRINES
jgi:polyhydroxyalkanoate synthesis regulator protein